MIKAKQAVVTSALGLAVLATPLALPNLGGSTGSAEAAEVGAEVTVDPVAIGQAIDDAKRTADNRSGFVKGAMEKAFFEAGQQHNVMVMNLSQGYNSNQVQGVQYFDTVDYNGITYGVWVFDEGTFVNEGDGGYDNWAFRGWFERTEEQGHTVNFHRP
ncbi:stress protein [Oceanobacillus arenosus]|uniref:Stress protein n=1 Tax=Oceanobacillus arenosus TaxID=1229153 RepID=A0A3D8PTI5_9BACI|nr:stress protein [Oceanobacillus arenosus]RDW19443.1 stress protein [Oceanobacillus arenosus]